MFRDVKVDDEVWSIQDGWGVVTNLDTGPYQLYVKFECREETFTLEGKSYVSNLYPTLFWDEIEIKAPKKPLPDLEVDAKILVWNVEGLKKHRRYFKEFTKSGKAVCFVDGHPLWTSCGETDVWNYWEVVEDV